MREEIPENWLVRTLGEVTRQEDQRVGNTVTPIVLSSTKHYGLVPSKTYFKKDVFSADLTDYKIVEDGWFAYATNHLTEGSIGHLEGPDGDRCVSPVYTVFSCNTEVYPPYLFRLLKQQEYIDHYKVYENASVDRRGAVKYEDFARIPVLLPPVEEQRKIAEILDAVDENIRSTERLVAKLGNERRGVMSDLFESERAGVSSWGRFSLSELLKHPPRNGYSPEPAERFHGVSVLGLGCLTEYGFEPAQLKNAPANTNRRNHAFLDDGDLLVSRANTRELVGLAGCYRDIGSPCIYPDLMMRMRPNKKVSARFLEMALLSPRVRRQVQSLASGTSESMVKISSATISDVRVPVPSHSLQDRIVEHIEEFDQRIQRERQELEKLRELKRGLMEDLLTGKVRVNAEEVGENL